MGRPLHRLALLGLCLLLGACGFHLRGQVSLPPVMARTAIVGLDPFNPLAREMERALRGSGVEVVEDEAAATAVLRVTRADAPRRLLSVQASGKAQEIELLQFLHFRLEDPSGKILLPEQQLEQRRDYYFDPKDPLGTTGQEPAIRRDMRRDIVQLMMLRLQAAPGRQE